MRSLSNIIFLENICFHSYHGVGKQETLVGNEFIINIKLKVNFIQATITDDVEDTVSYADVYEVIHQEMSTPSKLLEHVCGRIVNQLFNTFPTIEEIEIKLAKRHPPMTADIDTAGVEMHVSKR